MLVLLEHGSMGDASFKGFRGWSTSGASAAVDEGRGGAFSWLWLVRRGRAPDTLSPAHLYGDPRSSSSSPKGRWQFFCTTPLSPPVMP